MKLTPLEPWITRKIGAGPLAREKLAAYQLRKLCETLRLVRQKSPFYRDYLAGAPQDIAAPEELARLPFTIADDIRQDPLRFLCVSQGDIHRIVTLNSSGTTGEPKRLYFTGEDQELTLDFFAVGMSTLVEAGDRVLILLPGERPGSVGDLLATALARLGVAGLKHGPAHEVGATLEVIPKAKVNSLVGSPTQVLALARTRDSRGRPVPLRLKSVLLTTDHVPPAITRAVEQAWECRVFNHYGMTEMGLGGGVECQARRGYHLREADLYVEIVDPVSGQPVPPGESGEIVFTTLTRQGMPLVRYRTGDISRFLPGACPCGTVLPCLERVRDRLGGAVQVGPGVYLTMADLDDALFPLPEVLNFSAEVTSLDGQDLLRLQVMVIAGTEARAAGAIAKALESLPGLEPLITAGHLKFELIVRGAVNTGLLPSLAKRRIIDRRHQEEQGL